MVVITSGVPRKPGMSRDDLLQVNYNIMKQVTEQVVKHSPNCIIVPVANPLDAMCQAVYRLSGFPRERVIGMAGVLDSARMRTFIAQALDVSVENVHAFVLGGHGDTMVPLPRFSTVAGVPITELLPADQIAAISKRTAEGGAEITKLVGTSAWYAPGLAAAEMVEVILKDKKKILPCSVFLQGEYGVHDLFVGVPVKLGARGVEQIMQVHADRGGDRRTAQVGGRGEGTDRRHQGVSEACGRSRPVRARRAQRAGRGLPACRLLADGNRRGQLRVLPRNLQHAAAGRVLVDADRQLLHGAGGRALLQRDPAQVLLLVVDRPPLARLLVHDQLPARSRRAACRACTCPPGRLAPPIWIALSVVRVVASSAPVRQTFP